MNEVKTEVIQYMNALGYEIREGYKNDKALKIGRANQLTGISASFKVHKGKAINENDPNTAYEESFIYLSSDLQSILMDESHKLNHLGESILAHEFVHYLQPLHVGRNTNASNHEESYNKHDFEREAYHIAALFYFGLPIDEIPNDLHSLWIKHMEDTSKLIVQGA